MANKDMNNVERLIQDISTEAAEKAYTDETYVMVLEQGHPITTIDNNTYPRFTMDEFRLLYQQAQNNKLVVIKSLNYGREPDIGTVVSVDTYPYPYPTGKEVQLNIIYEGHIAHYRADLNEESGYVWPTVDGTTLYQHSMRIVYENQLGNQRYSFSVNILCSQSTPFTSASSLVDYCKNNFTYVNAAPMFPISSGYDEGTTKLSNEHFIGIYRMYTTSSAYTIFPHIVLLDTNGDTIDLFQNSTNRTYFYLFDCVNKLL